MIKTIYYLRWVCFFGILIGGIINSYSNQSNQQSIFWLSSLIYALSNLTLGFLSSKTKINHQIIILSTIIFDSLFLFFLIAKLGGSHNPFAILYIFIACVAATSLNRNSYIFSILVILTLLGMIYSGWFDPHAHHQSQNLKNHLQGMWIANSLAVLISSLWIYYLRKLNQKLEIKNLENQRIIFDLEKMDSLGKMMATTSHKINTSLGTIKLALSELNDQSVIENKKDRTEWIDHCKKALIQIDEVIGRMRLNEKKSNQNQLEKINLTQYLETSALNWAKPRKIDLETNINHQKFDTNLDTAEEIRDILFLLFDNAYQAYEDSFVSPKIIFSMIEKDKKLILKIEDFGSGMSEEIKNKVFDPLFTTKAQGTGIGLYSCYQTVKKLEGKIEIKSKIDQGTQVTIILPTKSI
jgi:signal transduction histidine kinase